MMSHLSRSNSIGSDHGATENVTSPLQQQQHQHFQQQLQQHLQLQQHHLQQHIQQQQRLAESTEGLSRRNTPPHRSRRPSGWGSPPTTSLTSLLNGSSSENSSPAGGTARPPRPPPVGARPVPASAIHAMPTISLPLPPPPAMPPSSSANLPPPLAALTSAFMQNGHHRRRGSSGTPPPAMPAMSPLLASQHGRPVSLGGRGGLAPHQGFQSNSLTPLYYMSIGQGRIMSRNINGTMAVTSHPSNESELQLYRVLQRAKLLSYFDTFIAQGGDDVHQLCEAGEEEFLEIMSLVGMATKPLHVRRLQKSLQEWVQNPALFQAPLMPLSSFSAPSAPAAVIRPPAPNVGPPGLPLPPGMSPTPTPLSTTTGPPPSSQPPPPSSSSSPSSSTSNIPISSSRSFTGQSGPSQLGLSQPQSPPPPVGATGSTSTTSAPHGATTTSLTTSRPSSVPHSPSPSLSLSTKESIMASVGGQSPTYSQGGLEYPSMSTSPLQITPVLVEAQIQRIAETAAALVKALPSNFEPNAKQMNKKKLSKDLEHVMAMSNEDNNKMEEIRKFSAIYGRFDCKRKPEKPLTLHEVSVNEAAAQLCFQLPALLMRRDKLFHLARKVVRDSGYQYSKGHSRSQFQADSSDLLGVNLNGGDDNSSRDSSSAGDRGSAEPVGSEGGKVAKKSSSRYNENDEFESSRASKRLRYLEGEDMEMRRRERYETINDEVRLVCDNLDELRSALTQSRDPSIAVSIHQQIEMLQDRHSKLLLEQQEHSRALQQYSRTRYSGRISTSSEADRVDTDDESQMSFSNHSSPTASPKAGNVHPPPVQHAGSYVLSASGGQIIAVQNPALSLSGALLRPTPSMVTSSIHADGRHSTITSSTNSSPLSTLLNLSRNQEGSNGNGGSYYGDHVTSPSSRPHVRSLRSSRSTPGESSKQQHHHGSGGDLVFKEEPVSPPRSSSPLTRASPISQKD